MNIRGPFTVKKGYLHLVCFYENGDLLLLFPVPRFTFNAPTPFEVNPILIGDIIEVPEGMRKVNRVEPIPALDIEQLEENLKNELTKKNLIFTNRIIAGYRYKLDKVWDFLVRKEE